jgi:hypothetical protein
LIDQSAILTGSGPFPRDYCSTDQSDVFAKRISLARETGGCMYSGDRSLDTFQITQPLLHGQWAGTRGDIFLKQSQLAIPSIDP